MAAVVARKIVAAGQEYRVGLVVVVVVVAGSYTAVLKMEMLSAVGVGVSEVGIEQLLVVRIDNTAVAEFALPAG